MDFDVYNSQNQEWDDEKDDYCEVTPKYLKKKEKDLLNKIMKPTFDTYFYIAIIVSVLFGLLIYYIFNKKK